MNTTCPRCKGEGLVSSVVLNGICFKCGGSGLIGPKRTVFTHEVTYHNMVTRIRPVTKFVMDSRHSELTVMQVAVMLLTKYKFTVLHPILGVTLLRTTVVNKLVR